MVAGASVLRFKSGFAIITSRSTVILCLTFRYDYSIINVWITILHIAFSTLSSLIINIYIKTFYTFIINYNDKKSID